MMSESPGDVGRLPLQAMSMAIPAFIFCATSLSIALTAAITFGLTERQTTSLVLMLYGLPALLSLSLTLLFRQPILAMWHTTGMVFLASLAGEFSYAEITGALIVTGAGVLLLGISGLTTRLAGLIPAPIVLGMLAGMILPYVVRVFTETGRDLTLIGLTVVAFFLGRRLLPARIPAILLAVVVGLSIAALSGQIQAPAHGWALPRPEFVGPVFAPRAVLTVAPVMFVLIAFLGNLPAAVYLRSQGYHAPSGAIDASTGATTMAGSLLGAAPITLASFMTPLTAGPDAGPRRYRPWSVYLCAFGMLGIALCATLAADLPTVLPLVLLLSLAGLSLSGVLAQTLTEITRGPLRLGPLFAFVVASSQMTVLGFGPFFWALIVGMTLTLVLERDELAAYRNATQP
jgi:benzoate membrane transport protein